MGVIVMKKMIILLAALLLLAGCGSAEVEPTCYFVDGVYCIEANAQGCVVTDDGNIWDYTQDIISEEPSYHNEPIVAIFYDAGTPDNIYDDEIIGLVKAA